MTDLGFGISTVASRRPSGPDWPDDAVAVWFIFGQSNAEGYAPRAQDPARTDPAAAVPALNGEETRAHPWVRFSTRGPASGSGRFTDAQGVATDTTPRTSGKVWTSGEFGIPVDTPCFGPEIGLIRDVLTGAVPSGWRDDAAPRLRVFKQVEGGRSVDHFRWGGPGRWLILDALRRGGGGETLSTLAATRTVLLQGMIFVIGEADARTARPDGSGTMATTFAPRFREWVRQLRGALGTDLPALFVEIHDEDDPRKVVANQGLEKLATSLSNAAVLPRQAGWSHIGDGVHYDAAGQDSIGRSAFGHFRERYGRASDGLVTGFPFSGLAPWFHVPPMLTDDLGDRMRIAATPAVSGTVHGLVLAEGAPTPTAAEIVAAGGSANAFSRTVSADLDEQWFTPFGSFLGNTTQDVHLTLQSEDGRLGETVVLRRTANARFGPDLSATRDPSGRIAWSARPTFAGALSWTLHEGAHGLLTPDDVEAEAFQPFRSGTVSVAANATYDGVVEGLAPGLGYTLTLTGRRDGDGARAVTQQVVLPA